MDKKEQDIIDLIEDYFAAGKYSNKSIELIRKIKNALRAFTRGEYFGKTSEEFRSHPTLGKIITHSYLEKNVIQLWLAIENYLQKKHDREAAQEQLSQVETLLKDCLTDRTPEAKARGMAMFPVELANAQFMKNLYSLNDDDLSGLFLKYLPAPKKRVFDGKQLPDIIAERESASMASIRNFLKGRETDASSIEKQIIGVQRHFRAKQRRQENQQRLPYLYRHFFNGSGRDLTPEQAVAAENFSKKILRDANRPYQPKGCDKALAQRIMRAAQNVRLFSHVRHLTAAVALESIFNEGLYGRQTMLQHYMAFRPAALCHSDIELGDANVVCLGSNEIDPLAKHGVELLFDAEKVSENNPCVFYKQRDLGFDPKKKRTIQIGDTSFSFSHTGSFRCASADRSSLVFFHYFPSEAYSFSEVIKSSLIADNVDAMHQILTLNFFRFIDVLRDAECHEDVYMKRSIYQSLERLNDADLQETLQRIGQAMTDTMEFNFYGAYKIDFSALLSINIEKGPSHYQLDLAHFREQLKKGEMEALEEAICQCPEVFKSYRFVDHLLSMTADETIISVLEAQRAKCALPAWMGDTEEGGASPSL